MLSPILDDCSLALLSGGDEEFESLLGETGKVVPLLDKSGVGFGTLPEDRSVVDPPSLCAPLCAEGICERGAELKCSSRVTRWDSNEVEQYECVATAGSGTGCGRSVCECFVEHPTVF